MNNVIWEPVPSSGTQIHELISALLNFSKSQCWKFMWLLRKHEFGKYQSEDQHWQYQCEYYLLTILIHLLCQATNITNNEHCYTESFYRRLSPECKPHRYQLTKVPGWKNVIVVKGNKIDIKSKRDILKFFPANYPACHGFNIITRHFRRILPL